MSAEPRSAEQMLTELIFRYEKPVASFHGEGNSVDLSYDATLLRCAKELQPILVQLRAEREALANYAKGAGKWEELRKAILETCDFAALATRIPEPICELCGHSLIDNDHGFDQNDWGMVGDDVVYAGQCTYCKVCRSASKKD